MKVSFVKASKIEKNHVRYWFRLDEMPAQAFTFYLTLHEKLENGPLDHSVQVVQTKQKRSPYLSVDVVTEDHTRITSFTGQHGTALMLLGNKKSTPQTGEIDYAKFEDLTDVDLAKSMTDVFNLITSPELKDK